MSTKQQNIALAAKAETLEEGVGAEVCVDNAKFAETSDVRFVILSSALDGHNSPEWLQQVPSLIAELLTLRRLWTEQLYFTKEEAAKYLRVDVENILYLVRIKELAFAPFGKGRKVFKKKDLDRAWEKRRKGSKWG